ncbi:oxalate:formate antiporter [Echinococcus multilocularis]|uniref:Oxalate:formate antiporter n=1 Tax=Echinococcus multilocularis TaxID=6211 RepID=A0A068Y8J1_ECHMU|nr:oxalate:formate antiporter [Echinococcus multilocularis]
MSYLKQRVDANVDPGSAVWISAIALAMQGISMPLGGAILPKIGYRAVVIIGSMINSGSVLLTYFTIQKGFVYVVITYAVMLGFGFGLSYAIIFSVAGSWFPKRRSFIVGLIVGGFGLGALVFTPIQTAYINPNNTMVGNVSKLFEEDALLDRVPTAFLLLGGSLAALQLIGILLLNQKPQPKNEPSTQEDGRNTKTELKSLVQSGDTEKNVELNDADTQETDDNAKKIAYRRSRLSLAQAHTHIKDFGPEKDGQKSLTCPLEINYPPLQTLRRHEFYLLWIVMLSNIIPITLITASFKLVGQMHISDDRFLSGVATASSLFNSGGRIAWGAVCDRFSFKGPLCLMLATWATILFTFPHVVAIKTGSMAIYAVWVCLLFLCLSGVFVLMPAATSRIFGPTYMAVNYGMIFSAFSIGSIICAVISEKLKGHWTLLYGICGSICLFALFITFWVVDPFIAKRANICSPCVSLLQKLQPRVPIAEPESGPTTSTA